MDLQFVLFTFKALSPFSPGETDLFFMAPAQRQLLCRPSVTLPSLPCTPSGMEFIVRPLFPPQHCVPEGCLICLPSRLWILQKAAYATHLSSCLPHKVWVGSGCLWWFSKRVSQSRMGLRESLLEFYSVGGTADLDPLVCESSASSFIYMLNWHVCVCQDASVVSDFVTLDCSSPGSSAHGVFQTRVQEWVAVPSSRGSCWPRNRTHVSTSPALAGGFFTTSVSWGDSVQNFIYKSSTGTKTIKTNISTCGPVLYIFQRKY